MVARTEVLRPAWGVMSATSVIAALALSGCGGTTIAPDDTDRQLLYSTEDERPEWTVYPPEADGDHHFFYGQSARHATERTARSDARADAVRQATQEAGIAAVERFEGELDAQGIDSEALDGQRMQREISSQIAMTVVSEGRPEEWHLERWAPDDAGSDPYWNAHVLLRVPQDTMEQMESQAIEAAETVIAQELGEYETDEDSGDPVTEELPEDDPQLQEAIDAAGSS